jgi:PhnB protein
MKINSYRMFDRNCEAAFKFYKQCLGGKITMMMTHKEAPSAENVPPELRNKIMHACLDLGDRSPLTSRILTTCRMRFCVNWAANYAL